MKKTWLVPIVLVLAACAHTSYQADSSSGPSNRMPASMPTTNNGKAWSADDPQLKVGDLTVWKLKEMAAQGQLAALNDMFDHGLNMAALPSGYSAGTGARVLGLPDSVVTKPVSKLLSIVTADNWRGKIFFESTDPDVSHGMNRIRQYPDSGSIVAMAAFRTQILTHHELTRDATSDVVVLNYADPKARPPSWKDPKDSWATWVEAILPYAQVYDVMVAYPGKYGPLYIGKTWIGSYDQDGEFHTKFPQYLIAWYFLDFNKGAMDEQKTEHSIGADEIFTNWHLPQ